MTNRRSRILAGLILALVVGLLSGPISPSVTTAAASTASCKAAIKKRPIYAPKGLTISCVGKHSKKLHGFEGYSWSYPNSEQVWVSTSVSRPLNIVAHEFAHGYSWQKMTSALRQQFAKKLGKKSWDSGSYRTRPSEVWAYNQGRCHGYPLNFNYRRVSCSLIKSFEKKVKALG